MAQSAYGIHANSASKRIQERFKNLYIAEQNGFISQIPEYKYLLPAIVALEHNVQQSKGIPEVIDVQLDYRNTIAYFAYHIKKTYPDMNFKDLPFLTPASLLGYYLALMYAFALVNDDVNVRTRKSKYSSVVKNSHTLDHFLIKLRDFSVPPFMIPLLESLTVSKDERTPNLTLANTLACFDIEYDFARTPPIHMFFLAHNLIATRPSNIHPNDLINEWLNSILINEPINLTVAQYLGLLAPNANYINWFAEINLSIFNPVTTRSNTLRPTFERMNIQPQQFTDNVNDINPYIHLLCIDSTNRTTVTKILQALSSSSSQLTQGCVKVSDIFNKMNNTSLFNHYYQRLLLPTWHRSTPTDSIATNGTAENFAKTQNFRIKPTFPDKSTIAIPARDGKFTTKLYLAVNESYSEQDDPVIFETFNADSDVTDDIRHFCPFETASQNIYNNIISGKLIECEEVTSFSVPQPDPSNNLQNENSMYLQSAVSFDKITPVFNDPTHPTNIVRVPLNNPHHPIVRIDLLNRSEDRIPHFMQDLTTRPDAELPGFNYVRNLPHTQFACNSFGHILYSYPKPVNLPKGTRPIHGWSSYRYENVHNTEHNNPRMSKHMLFNFRPNFGTNVTLVQTPHPYLVIPST